MILINIGDELLIGQVVNTNAAFVGQQMAAAGFPLTDVITIGDDGDNIRQTLRNAFDKTDIVMMTGGLGPTRDDITKKVICDMFHRELVIDEKVLQHVTDLFAARGMELTETNRQQAAVPEGCTVLFNVLGTARDCGWKKTAKSSSCCPAFPLKWSD